MYYERFIRTPIPVENFTTGEIEQHFEARRRGQIIESNKRLDPSTKNHYVASLIAVSACIAAPRQAIGWRNLTRRAWAYAVALRYSPIFDTLKHCRNIDARRDNVYRIRSRTILNIIKAGDYLGVPGFFPSRMIKGRLLLVKFKAARSVREVASYIAPTASSPGVFYNRDKECFMFAWAPPDSMEEFMSRLRGRGLVSSYQVNVIRAAKHTSLAWEMYNPLDGRWCRALEPRGLKACHEKGIVYWSKAGIILFIKAALQDRDEGAWRQYMDSMEFLGGA
ncbi:MAG: hypothetical protein GXO09_03640 [Crenarchaeota archaeon]|nr:hypothetical protein [Thermoproteota archaeon]